MTLRDAIPEPHVTRSSPRRREESVHAFACANGCQAVHDDVLLMHIEATPLASVAASVRVTVGTRVHAALLLILTDPVGGSSASDA